MPNSVPLTQREMALIEAIAERDGISTSEAATNLVSAAIARRVKKKTGKTQARVYPLGGKRK